MKKKPQGKSPGVIGGSVQRSVRGQLRREIHKFIDNVTSYAEQPENWPLTQEQQIAFVRTVIFQARKIRNTEDYRAETVELAAEDLAMAS